MEMTFVSFNMKTRVVTASLHLHLEQEKPTASRRKKTHYIEVCDVIFQPQTCSVDFEKKNSNKTNGSIISI